MSATIQRPPTVERGETRRERPGRPPHPNPHAQKTEARTAGVVDLLVAIAEAAGTAVGFVLAGATWVVGRGAEKLRSDLSAPRRGPDRSTEAALRILRRAGLLDEGDRTAGAAIARATRRPQPSVPRTLVLESDPIKRGYVERLCREDGHAVSVHAEEDAAWDALRENRPDVILVGGAFAPALAFCRRVRGHEVGGTVVTVLLDWQGGRAHAQAARAAGADDYVDAPADIGWLHLRLEAIAEQVHSRVTARGAAARQETMWADLAKRVADAYAEQDATETALRRALVDSSNAEERIRSAVADIDRQVAEQAGRLRTLEEAVVALAARLPRGGEPTIAGATAESSSRRPIRIPVDTISSLAPEGRGLTSVEREHLRLVRPGAEEGAGTSAGAVVPGVPGDPAVNDDPDADDPGARLVAGVPVVLRGAMRTALEPLGQRAHQKKIGFGWHVAPDVPEGVIGVGGRFAQLRVHVVGHAIRSTDQGEVPISVRLGTRASSTLVLLGSVADSSAGLIVEDQRRLFEALGRDEDPVRTVSTAAGLALAGHLVRSMGGQIWFESELDHGTTVRFTMRLGGRTGTSRDAVDEAVGWVQLPRRRPGGSAGPGLDLLVVDDIPEDRVEVARALEQRGHRVVVASDGHEALGVAVAAPFDAVLINLRLPGMDGFELAAVLRTLEGRRGRRLPIVALTAMLLAGDLERCAAAGIDACLRKPLDGDGILGTVAGLLANPRRHSVPESA